VVLLEFNLLSACRSLSTVHFRYQCVHLRLRKTIFKFYFVVFGRFALAIRIFLIESELLRLFTKLVAAKKNQFLIFVLVVNTLAFNLHFSLFI